MIQADGRRKWRYRLLIIVEFSVSAVVFAVTVDFLRLIIQARNIIKRVWEGKIGEDFWGIGQIAAIFTWVPLLVDLGYTAAKAIKARRHRYRSGSTSSVTGSMRKDSQLLSEDEIKFPLLQRRHTK